MFGRVLMSLFYLDKFIGLKKQVFCNSFGTKSFITLLFIMTLVLKLKWQL